MTKSTQKPPNKHNTAMMIKSKSWLKKSLNMMMLEIVAEVDIDNQAVSDVLIIRDTDTKADQADHTDDASKVDDETVVDGVKQKLKRFKKILRIKHKIFRTKPLKSLKSPKRLPKIR